MLGDIKVEYTPLTPVEVDGMRGVTFDAYPQGFSIQHAHTRAGKRNGPI